PQCFDDAWRCPECRPQLCVAEDTAARWGSVVNIIRTRGDGEAAKRMNILNPILSYVLLYKYATIALVVYFAAVILPLPSNAMLLAVGAFASQGYFNFWAALATAVIANTLGDLTDYAITRRWGERVTRILHLHQFKF